MHYYIKNTTAITGHKILIKFPSRQGKKYKAASYKFPKKTELQFAPEK